MAHTIRQRQTLAAPRPAPEREAFRAFVGARAATRDRTPRSTREAFPVERVAAIELPAEPRFDPERYLVGPGLAVAAIAIAALLAHQSGWF